MRNRVIADIIADMSAKGMSVTTAKYLAGADIISFKGPWHGVMVKIAFNTENGKFMVADADTKKIIATDKSKNHAQWYRELEKIFYTKERAK